MCVCARVCVCAHVQGLNSCVSTFLREEEDEEQTQVTSLLDAKRRGLSRSALRSHQPVARPITAGLSR